MSSGSDKHERPPCKNVVYVGLRACIAHACIRLLCGQPIFYHSPISTFLVGRVPFPLPLSQRSLTAVAAPAERSEQT